MATAIRLSLGRYVLAGGVVGLVLMLSLLGEPLLGKAPSLLLFLGAILVSFWFGGQGPGWLSLGLAALAAGGFLLLPVSSVATPSHLVEMLVLGALFLLVGGLIAGFAGRVSTVQGFQERREEDRRQADPLAEIDGHPNAFLAILAHELRNPLAPVRNALQLLKAGDLREPKLIQAREVIDRQVQHLARVVDDLLEVFQIASHQVELHKEPLDLVYLVRLTAEGHRSGLENNRLSLHLELPDHPLWVHADPTRLAQVLSNLLQNAAKFTNAGGRVIVRLAEDAAAQRAIVAVRDTGSGIAPEMLAHVFDIFCQADQNIDRQRGGLGLGLGLVKGLMELHGGQVQATSPGLGQGAEISFWLPLAKQPRVAQPAGCSPLTSARQLRILIVEDHIDTARTLQSLLSRYGHEVTTAQSGTEGVRAAQQWHPEVVLCDLGLPEMDGFEVASTLRHNPDTAWARLIAMSGYGQEEDRQRSEEAGFDLHLTKPVDPVELQRLLAVLKVGP